MTHARGLNEAFSMVIKDEYINNFYNIILLDTQYDCRSQKKKLINLIKSTCFRVMKKYSEWYIKLVSGSSTQIQNGSADLPWTLSFHL